MAARSPCARLPGHHILVSLERKAETSKLIHAPPALRKLHLESVQTFGATPQTIPHFHLTSLELTSSNLQADDWRVLGVAGAGTLQHLALVHMGIRYTALDEATTALAAWAPSLISLHTRSSRFDFQGTILPSLPSATSLQYLSIPLDYAIGALVALPATDGSTGLVALGVDICMDRDSPIDESYLAVLNMIGRFPVDELKIFAYPAVHQQEDSVPLYEVVSALGMRGVEVVHGSLPPCEGF